MLYLKSEEHWDKSKVKDILIKHVDYTDEQAELALEHAKRHGKCLILEGTKEEVSRVTILLAENGISAEVGTKTIK